MNRVASPRHERLLRQGMETAGIEVLGALPRLPALALPERHLGLVQAMEQAGLDAVLDDYADLVRAHIDMAALKALAGGSMASPRTRLSLPPPGQRVAVALDAAFSFFYPHMLAGWQASGAQILPFSPLADEAPALDADCVWLPGGYPELHAGQIAAAGTFLAGLRRHAKTRPVHGECGGYMVLGAGLVDKDGGRHAMAGLLGLVTSYADRRLHLGYRQATLLTPAVGFATGVGLRGHEFHYSTIVDQPDPPLALVVDPDGVAVAETGSYRGRVTGSFFHLVAPTGSAA